MLKREFLLDYNDETLWEYGWEEFNNTIKKMDILAKEIDPNKTTKELLIEIKNEYPENITEPTKILIEPHPEPHFEKVNPGVQLAPIQYSIAKKDGRRILAIRCMLYYSKDHFQ